MKIYVKSRIYESHSLCSNKLSTIWTMYYAKRLVALPSWTTPTDLMVAVPEIPRWPQKGTLDHDNLLVDDNLVDFVNRELFPYLSGACFSPRFSLYSCINVLDLHKNMVWAMHLTLPDTDIAWINVFRIQWSVENGRILVFWHLNKVTRAVPRWLSRHGNLKKGTLQCQSYVHSGTVIF